MSQLQLLFYAITINYDRKKTYPDIKLSRPDGLRESCGIDQSSGQVEEGHWNQCSESGKVDGLVVSVGNDVVNHRYAATHSERYESTCTKNVTRVTL